jgi:sugar (pentulose or hexulose) kinase
MSIFADVFGIPATRSAGPGGASLGAAICAAAAAGVCESLEDGVERMTGARERFVPNGSNADTYRRLDEAVYRSIRDATDPILERSFPLFH